MNNSKLFTAVATCAALAAPAAFAKIMASQKKEIAGFDRWLASKRNNRGDGSGASKQSK